MEKSTPGACGLNSGGSICFLLRKGATIKWRIEEPEKGIKIEPEKSMLKVESKLRFLLREKVNWLQYFFEFHCNSPDIYLQMFHDFAVRSTSRTDLLAGIDEFLSASSLLPPAQWDPKTRIEPPHVLPSQVNFPFLLSLSSIFWVHTAVGYYFILFWTQVNDLILKLD